MQHRNADVVRRGILAMNIKAFVKESNKTQLEIAKKLGITTRMLQRYIAGTSEPTALVLYSLSEFLDVDIKRFFLTYEEWMSFVHELVMSM